MAHVVCFIQHYHTPDCPTSARPYSLIQHLARRHVVTLIASNAWRKRRLTSDFEWVPSSVRLLELPVAYGNRMGTTRRFLAFASYAARAVAAGLPGPAPDVVFGTSTPLSTGVVAALVARWHGVPWVFEVRDLWPDFPIQAGAVSSTWAKAGLYRLERALYRDAAHVIGLSPDMTEHIKTFVPASCTSTVLYGTDQDLAAEVEPIAIRSLRKQILNNTSPPPAPTHHTHTSETPTFVVLYAGSYGRANAIPSLIETARLLQRQTHIRFVFSGDGYHAADVRTAARNLATVYSLPPLPHSAALTLFAAADLSIVSFANLPVLATNSPGKLFDSLTMGTPAIVTHNGWYARWVNKHHCGWSVPPENPAACADMIQRLSLCRNDVQTAGQNARHVARHELSRLAAVQHIESIISQTASSSPKRT